MPVDPAKFQKVQEAFVEAAQNQFTKTSTLDKKICALAESLVSAQTSFIAKAFRQVSALGHSPSLETIDNLFRSVVITDSKDIDQIKDLIQSAKALLETGAKPYIESLEKAVRRRQVEVGDYKIAIDPVYAEHFNTLVSAKQKAGDIPFDPSLVAFVLVQTIAFNENIPFSEAMKACSGGNPKKIEEHQIFAASSKFDPDLTPALFKKMTDIGDYLGISKGASELFQISLSNVVRANWLSNLQSHHYAKAEIIFKRFPNLSTDFVAQQQAADILSDVLQSTSLLKRTSHSVELSKPGLERVESLLACGVNPKALSRSDYLLPKESDIELVPGGTYTPIGLALIRKDFSLLKILLLRGADANMPFEFRSGGWHRMSPIEFASSRNLGEEVTHLLKTHGARSD